MSNVNHPAHYNAGKIEVIEAIEDWGFTKNHHRATAIKYLARAGKKVGSLEKTAEDLNKAIWYIKRELALIETEATGEPAPRPNDMNPRESAPGESATDPRCAHPECSHPFSQHYFNPGTRRTACQDLTCPCYEFQGVKP